MNFKLLIQYDGTDFHGWQIQENQRTVQGELQRVLSLLENYYYPGNVRELENIIERAVVIAPTDEITVECLRPEVRDPQYTFEAMRSAEGAA